jgi:hypothetical protein
MAKEALMRDPVLAEIRFQAVAAALPEGRFRRLLREVFDRLPDGWDTYRTWTVELSEQMPTKGYASCLRLEEEEGDTTAIIEGHREQNWIVTLYTPWLDRLSDRAALWAIAHELGHVASGMACGSLVISGTAYTRVSSSEDQLREITPEEREAREKVADVIARAWGFSFEEEAFEEEAQNLT